MPDSYTIRLASAADAPALAQMRHRMFLDLGKPDTEALRSVVRAFESWFADAMRRGTYITWIVDAPNGEPIANAGLLFVEWPPDSRDLNTVRGYIQNVWTHPDHRRRGLARRLTETAFAEARRRQIKVTALHASDDGKALYEQLGFRQSREMIRVEEG